MIEIDCMGEMCPVPILLLKRAIPQIRRGEQVMIITDHSCVFQSLYDYCESNGLNCCTEEVMNGVWELTVTDGRN